MARNFEVMANKFNSQKLYLYKFLSGTTTAAAATTTTT